MNDMEFAYRLGHLLISDPDDVVAWLGVTTEELVEAFPDKVDAYIEREFG